VEGKSPSSRKYFYQWLPIVPQAFGYLPEQGPNNDKNIGEFNVFELPNSPKFLSLNQNRIDAMLSVVGKSRLLKHCCWACSKPIPDTVVKGSRHVPTCSGCKSATYCSDECLNADWKSAHAYEHDLLDLINNGGVDKKEEKKQSPVVDNFKVEKSVDTVVTAVKTSKFKAASGKVKHSTGGVAAVTSNKVEREQLKTLFEAYSTSLSLMATKPTMIDAISNKPVVVKHDYTTDRCVPLSKKDVNEKMEQLPSELKEIFHSMKKQDAKTTSDMIDKMVATDTKCFLEQHMMEWEEVASLQWEWIEKMLEIRMQITTPSEKLKIQTLLRFIVFQRLNRVLYFAHSRSDNYGTLDIDGDAIKDEALRRKAGFERFLAYLTAGKSIQSSTTDNNDEISSMINAKDWDVAEQISTELAWGHVKSKAIDVLGRRILAEVAPESVGDADLKQDLSDAFSQVVDASTVLEEKYRNRDIGVDKPSTQPVHHPFLEQLQKTKEAYDDQTEFWEFMQRYSSIPPVDVDIKPESGDDTVERIITKEEHKELQKVVQGAKAMLDAMGASVVVNQKKTKQALHDAYTSVLGRSPTPAEEKAANLPDTDKTQEYFENIIGQLYDKITSKYVPNPERDSFSKQKKKLNRVLNFAKKAEIQLASLFEKDNDDDNIAPFNVKAPFPGNSDESESEDAASSTTTLTSSEEEEEDEVTKEIGILSRTMKVIKKQMWDKPMEPAIPIFKKWKNNLSPGFICKLIVVMLFVATAMYIFGFISSSETKLNPIANNLEYKQRSKELCEMITEQYNNVGEALDTVSNALANQQSFVNERQQDANYIRNSTLCMEIPTSITERIFAECHVTQGDMVATGNKKMMIENIMETVQDNISAIALSIVGINFMKNIHGWLTTPAAQEGQYPSIPVNQVTGSLFPSIDPQLVGNPMYNLKDGVKRELKNAGKQLLSLKDYETNFSFEAAMGKKDVHVQTILKNQGFYASDIGFRASMYIQSGAYLDILKTGVDCRIDDVSQTIICDNEETKSKLIGWFRDTSHFFLKHQNNAGYDRNLASKVCASWDDYPNLKMGLESAMGNIHHKYNHLGKDILAGCNNLQNVLNEDLKKMVEYLPYMLHNFSPLTWKYGNMAKGALKQCVGLLPTSTTTSLGILPLGNLILDSFITKGVMIESACSAFYSSCNLLFSELVNHFGSSLSTTSTTTTSDAFARIAPAVSIGSVLNFNGTFTVLSSISCAISTGMWILSTSPSIPGWLMTKSCVTKCEELCKLMMLRLAYLISPFRKKGNNNTTKTTNGGFYKSYERHKTNGRILTLKDISDATDVITLKIQRIKAKLDVEKRPIEIRNLVSEKLSLGVLLSMLETMYNGIKNKTDSYTSHDLLALYGGYTNTEHFEYDPKTHDNKAIVWFYDKLYALSEKLNKYERVDYPNPFQYVSFITEVCNDIHVVSRGFGLIFAKLGLVSKLSSMIWNAPYYYDQMKTILEYVGGPATLVTQPVATMAMTAFKITTIISTYAMAKRIYVANWKTKTGPFVVDKLKGNLHENKTWSFVSDILTCYGEFYEKAVQNNTSALVSAYALCKFYNYTWGSLTGVMAGGPGDYSDEIMLAMFSMALTFGGELLRTRETTSPSLLLNSDEGKSWIAELTKYNMLINTGTSPGTPMGEVKANWITKMVSITEYFKRK